MNSLIANSIPNLTNDQLFELVRDCESRIGSNVAGGMADNMYVEKQRAIIDAVQKEFANRTN